MILRTWEDSLSRKEGNMTKRSSCSSSLAVCLWVVCFGLLLLTNGCSSETEGPSDDRVVLENQHVSLALDKSTGAIHWIEDKGLNQRYDLKGTAFVLTIDGSPVSIPTEGVVEKTDAGVNFTFTQDRFDITLFYRLGSDDRFVEQWLEVKANDDQGFMFNNVVLGDVATGDWLKEIHFHDDNSTWHCPINYFLRGTKGGCFAGLAWPYWQHEQRGDKGFAITFAPNYTVKPGDVFTTEKYFLGVYAYEGIYRYSHGAYPRDAKPQMLTFNNCSVSIHIKESFTVDPEVLDWGEAWAMQAYTHHFFGEHVLPEDGYWAWVNSWWAWAYNSSWKLDKKTIDMLADVGVKDIMTQPIWYGHGQHPGVCDYIAKMDPTQPPHFELPTAYQELVDYGLQKGVNVGSFCCPGVYFNSKPEWLAMREDGKPAQYNVWSNINCFANDEHMDFMLELYDEIFDKYPVRYWGFDGRWLSFREFPYEDGRNLPIGYEGCWAENHGHLPGDNFYAEWKNISTMLTELRKRHPRICLEAYYGIKRAEPWAKAFNATENYYESNGSDLDRFQQWHNQNDRFIPPSRNYAAVFGRNSEDFQYSFLACISASPYCQVGAGLHQLNKQENRDFFKQWRQWASDNHKYLFVKRDLFRSPGYDRLDGSAHIIDDRGFLFLFPTGTQPNTHTPGNDDGLKAKLQADTSVLRASIKINHWLGLDVDEASEYVISEVYPRQRTLGVYRYGDELLYDVQKNKATILSLAPREGSEPVTSEAPYDENAQDVHLSRAFWDDVYSPAEFLGLSKEERAERILEREDMLCERKKFNKIDGVAAEHLEFKQIEAAQFVSQAVDLGNLQLQAPATVAVWIRPEDIQNDRRILGQLAGATTQGGTLRLQEGQLQVWNGSAWQVLIAEGIAAETWTHITVVYEPSGQASAYLNGHKQQSAPSGFDFVGTSAGIGARFLNQNGNEFLGLMKDFQIRRHALSQEEITKLAEDTDHGANNE